MSIIVVFKGFPYILSYDIWEFPEHLFSEYVPVVTSE